MKKILLLIPTLMIILGILSGCCAKTGLWTIESYLDESGEETDEKYLCSEFIKGSFNDIPAKGEDAYLKIYMDKNGEYLKLWENNTDGDPVTADTSREYQVTIDNVSGGGKTIIIATMNENGEIHLNQQVLVNLIQISEKLRIFVRDISISSGYLYSFYIEGGSYDLNYLKYVTLYSK